MPLLKRQEGTDIWELDRDTLLFTTTSPLIDIVSPVLFSRGELLHSFSCPLGTTGEKKAVS